MFSSAFVVLRHPCAAEHSRNFGNSRFCILQMHTDPPLVHVDIVSPFAKIDNKPLGKKWMQKEGFELKVIINFVLFRSECVVKVFGGV